MTPDVGRQQGGHGRSYSRSSGHTSEETPRRRRAGGGDGVGTSRSWTGCQACNRQTATASGSSLASAAAALAAAAASRAGGWRRCGEPFGNLDDVPAGMGRRFAEMQVVAVVLDRARDQANRSRSLGGHEADPGPPTLEDDVGGQRGACTTRVTAAADPSRLQGLGHGPADPGAGSPAVVSTLAWPARPRPGSPPRR